MTAARQVVLLLLLVNINEIQADTRNNSVTGSDVEYRAFQSGFHAGAASVQKVNAESSLIKWEGSFNSTHGTATAHTDGLTDECKADAECERGCRTNIRVQIYADVYTPKARNTCTSCRRGYSLSMGYHKSKAGSCVNYTNTNSHNTISCARLDKDKVAKSSANASQVVCTKIRTDTATVMPKEFGHGSPEYKLLSLGLGQYGQVKCRVWKQTVCRHGVCRVKKEVECLEVCKLTKWHDDSALTLCDSKYCATPKIAAQACSKIAMMA